MNWKPLQRKVGISDVLQVFSYIKTLKKPSSIIKIQILIERTFKQGQNRITKCVISEVT